ncbi:HMG domain-containing protein 4a [Lepisosteus oculatus]|uniref:HMG domain-containing protein 4a n=1 Tax=Lepisosteus oculatus TaxID=7918 RepID=UPI0035F52F1D
MSYEEIKKKGVLEVSVLEGGVEEMGLVAGRSQREKKRSYKDLLREEEEIAAQVRKSSKKRPKDSELYLLGGDPHRKKKKHSSEEYYYRDPPSPGGLPPKKKRKLERVPPLPPHPTDTAMGLLQAITSPLATGAQPSNPGPAPHHHSNKDRRRSGGEGGRPHPGSHPHRPPPSSSSKKHKSALLGPGAPEPPLTLREADGLKMKLILSPKEKGESGGGGEGFSYPSPLSSSSSPLPSGVPLKKASRKPGGAVLLSKAPRKKLHPKDPLPIVVKEVEVEGRLAPGLCGGPLRGADSSSSGAELEAGELVIDDSYREVQKKKKKSKKSKKKKERERERHRGDKKHSKSSKRSAEGGPSAGAAGSTTVLLTPADLARGHAHTHSSANHSSGPAPAGGAYGGVASGGGAFAMSPPAVVHHHSGSESQSEKKKRKEERDREKAEKEKPKKKNMTAYQVFCKEYRVNITSEHPGLVFGELSRKLAEVWKQLPEKDKLVWRQKAQYLQHKQNKAEATTVKRKSSSSEPGKSKGSVRSVSSPCRKSPSGSVAVPLSPARAPEVDPIDAAAHLQLLGESLSLIGHRLQETEGMVAVSGSLSVLLDSILCALGPLTCLTAQVPELNSCPRHVLSNTLDNIAYVMPGL